MSGCLQQRWVSYAGNDAEAWKCLLLVRSLKRSLTTRPFGVIISDKVSIGIGRRLQDEVQQCYWVSEDDDPEFKGLQFRSIAKLVSEKQRELHKSVFLDCNCVVLKNCDKLFRQGGTRVQLFEEENDQQFGAVVIKSRSDGVAEVQLFMEMIVERENRGKFVVKTKNRNGPGSPALHVELDEMDFCYGIDVTAPNPTPLPGRDVRMICFLNGHPNDLQTYGKVNILEKRGLLEMEAVNVCISCCPELYPPEMQKQDLPDKIPWELNNSIAIIGMGCRYPCANTIAEFWKLLEEGREGIRKVPEDRWTKENSFIRMDNMQATEAGFLSCSIDNFDAKFFNTNLVDMHYLDPQQRLSLRVVWEALEHAGVDPNLLKNSLTGVFGGWWRNDYKEMLQMLGIVDTDFLRGYMGNALGPLTARISHFFELIGPSFSTESGCSTSVAGVDMACDSLRSDACNLAIAVGANLLLHPFSPSVMEGVLSPTGRCRTFDASADGFGRAEGIGVLILKRFSDAVANGDRIWGLIRGSAIVQEGPSKSMGTPTVDVEAKAMALALERAGVDPNDVEFVETHGTGTPVGDPIEVAAVAKAYSKRDNVLTIGSVKTNIGHTESVCGIAGIQKSVLAMKYELIPKHLNLTELNKEIDLAAIPARVPMEALPWKRRGKGEKPRIAGINSFGITGAQAHVLVQEPPTKDQLPPYKFRFSDSRLVKMLTFSGKSDSAFKAQVASYMNLLKDSSSSNLDDIEFSMHTGRPHMNIRQVAVGATKEALLKSIESMPKGKSVPNMVPPLCFMFTGQGSQYPGMGKDLYHHNIVFRSNFDWCNSVLTKDHGLASLKEVLWSGDDSPLLKTTLYSQTAIFCIEYCLLRLWESWGVKPDAVLGHSLGEFAAAVAASLITEEDAIKLVVTRSKLIDKLQNGSMLVVGGNVDTVQDALGRAFAKEDKKWLDIAAVNSPSQTVLAGETKLVQEFKLYCDNNDIKTHVLDAAHAFHSKMMDPMLAEYEKVAATVKHKTKEEKKGGHAKNNKGVTFISGVEGRVLTKLDATYWLRHTRERVRFLEASHTAVREGQGLFLEVGPHPVLSALMLTNVDDVADVVVTPSLRRKTVEWETMLSSLGKLYTLGVPIIWENFHRYSPGQKIDLPGYYFEETPYWMNIKDEGNTPFHPLLGSFVPNPSDMKIFKSSVNVHRLPFLKDHSLGDKIIFPCVGYVDMCMTAGYAATHCGEGAYVKPQSPLCVRNFSIVTPVCLSEMEPTEFQVTVVKTPQGDTCSTIYTKVFLEDSTYKWICNATATFNTNPPPPPDPELLKLDGIKARCTAPFRSKTFDYDELVDFGFNFGPSCRTVHTAWRNPADEGEWLFPFSCHESKEDLDRFVIHPWVTDPMLQTQIIALGLLHDGQVRKRLVVPVQIDNFTWWGHSASKGYVYMRNTATGNSAYLLDDDGKLMVSMVGTEFMDTTLSNILSLIDSQKNPYPRLAEVAWREKLGPEERRINRDELASIPLKEMVVDIAKEEEESADRVELAEFYTELDKLAVLYMLKALKELGLDVFEAKKEFNFPEMMEQLGIVPGMEKMLRHILQEMTADGWFIEDAKNDVYKFRQALPQLPIIQKEMDSIIKAMMPSMEKGGKSDFDSVIMVGQILSKILTGKEVFPPNMEEIFLETSPLFTTISTLIPSSLLTRLSTLGGPKSVVRVLEVGAGTGRWMTRHLVPTMLEAGVSHFDYTFTNVSTSNLKELEGHFEGTGISAKFALLDLEKNPLDQGYAPGQFDIILGNWVLHQGKNAELTLGNLKKLLRPGGYINLNEVTTAKEPGSRAAKLMLGVGGMNSIQANKAVLNRVGFEVESWGKMGAIIAGKVVDEIKTKTAPDTTWIVFGDGGSPVCNEFVKKLQQESRVEVITRSQVTGDAMEEKIKHLLQSTMGDENVDLKGIMYLWGLDHTLTSKEACEPFLYIGKYLCSFPKSLRVVLLTQGNMSIGPSDFYQTPPHNSPLIAMINVLANENQDMVCKCVDMDPNPTTSTEQAVAEAFTELFATDVDVAVAYRKGQRCTPRLRPYKFKSAPLAIPNTPRYRLYLPASHLISDLTFAPCDPEPLEAKMVEIEVKAYALNFLDVLMVTKPDPVFQKYNYLGVDIAGVVSAVGPGCERKVGERVVVVRRSGIAMPSHLMSKDERTLIIPDEMTFAEAATFPMGILTVATCLIEVAKVVEGDVVLIHTASGGVGHVGIQIAQRLGCTVVVTAGSERKRNFLRGLGLQHVFNSRNTDYETDIRKALGGRGVTIVLNSLTSPGFKEATLALCEKGARFIEMSKMNIWSKAEVKKLRPDVFYEVVDVSTLPTEKLNEISVYIQGELMRKLGERPKPSPYTRFDASEIRDALEYMEKVKHIGKIVLVMADKNKTTAGAGVGSQFPLFTENSTYMITGGLGGIGLEVAKWMGSNGAKNILLLGRSDPKPEALEKIESLRSSGVRVEVRTCDVGEMSQVKELFKEFEPADGLGWQPSALPPLRGIMHAAGLLQDATFENQSWDKYEAVFQSKVKGAWNLHEMTLNLPFPLEHFVLFSSITATFGAVAQSNYSAANQYLDSLAHYRYSIGLPATTINWGQWGQVGLAANLVVAMNKPLTTHQGLAALGHVIKSHKTQVVAHETDLGAVKQVLPSAKGLLADIEHDAAGGQNELDGEEFWREYDAVSTRDEKYEVVRKFLKRLIRLTLKMDKNEDVEDHVAFQDMGMDSLMMVEMKNGLQASVGKRVKISINAVKDCKTLVQLSDRLVELISGLEELPTPTASELKHLVSKDATLPENFKVDTALRATLGPLSKVSTALVIGATGTLGPYLMRELFARESPNLQKVYVLMQPNPLISPMDRFCKVYEKKGLLSSIPLDRMECIAGDVKEPMFGMKEATYTQLCSEVQVVFNLAVKVAFDEIYRETADPKSSRVVNVFGMQNVLTFAVEKQLKYVYHASTFAAETMVDEDGCFWEGWPKEEEVLLFPNSAYSISKLICDRLVEQAVWRGVPCKVFRLPQIGGDSVKGGNVQLDSFLMMRMLAYMYIGSMHAANIPLSLMAVDQCAKISVDLFFNEKAGYEMFNVLNPHLGDEKDFESLAREFGVAVKIMDSHEFLEKFKQLDSSDEFLQLVKYTVSHDTELLYLKDTEMPYYLSWRGGNKKVFHSKKLEALMPGVYPECITPSWEILRRDLKYAKDIGVFDRYKIKHSNPYLL